MKDEICCIEETLLNRHKQVTDLEFLIKSLRKEINLIKSNKTKVSFIN